jgi:hypothetical protein
MSFLPIGTKLPDTSKYMKFKEGQNRFRALGEAIIGTEYWVEDEEGNRKPIRVPINTFIPMEKVSVNKYGKKQVNFFMAFPVYNYASDSVQILEITQRTVQEGIMGLYNNPEWGDLTEYDVIVTQAKKGDRTIYPSIQANPKKKLDENIKELWANTYINLNKLFDGGDPFNKDESVDSN